MFIFDIENNLSIMKKIIVLLITVVISSCASSTVEVNDPIDNTPQSIWVNVEEPFPSGENGLFPLVKNPMYKLPSGFNNLKDDDKVALVSFQNQIKVYPYLYTNKSEIVNDSIGEFFYAVSYCPQTKSAINYNRIIQNDTLDLVASGYLYKDNMVPSDKNFNFYWSQMLLKGITNDAVSKNLQTLNVIQTNWKTVVDFFPDAKVYYYEGDIITPKINHQNNPIENKTTAEISNADPVFSIIENHSDSGKTELVHAYALKSFNDNNTLQEIIIDSKPTLLLSNKQHYFFTTFIKPNGLDFQLENSNFPPILTDNEGTKWNAFGYAYDAPRKGQQLTSAKSYIASWWAWKDFFENIEIK